MPRKPDERITQAKELFLGGMKLVEIASQLNLPEGTVEAVEENDINGIATLQGRNATLRKEKGRAARQ